MSKRDPRLKRAGVSVQQTKENQAILRSHTSLWPRRGIGSKLGSVSRALRLRASQRLGGGQDEEEACVFQGSPQTNIAKGKTSAAYWANKVKW